MSLNEMVEKFLNFLEVPVRDPDISLLNELIRSHQIKVRWETVTKILDHEQGAVTNDFMPSLETYFERIMNDGYGGACWTVSRGFYWLLQQLGFDVHYLYMEPGHLCLRVDLDQPYYVDVGYCAPLFQAYPLFKSFVASDDRETFEYTVSSEEIRIVRTPGPTKTLHTNPVQFEDMQPLIIKSNDWKTSFSLKDIMIFGYIDNIPTSLTNQTVKQYFPGNKVEKELDREEREYWITKRFQMNYELYEKAVHIFNRNKKHS